MDAPAPRRSRLSRAVWWVIAHVMVGLAVLGLVLPLLPATPFLLLAVYSASRGSPRLHARIMNQPTLGPMVTAWRDHGAIARRTKYVAFATMVASAALTWWLAPWYSTVAAIVIMACSGMWIWRQPEPPREAPASATRP